MLPRFLRQWAAGVMTFSTKEIGGVLHDYKNGLWEKLCVWNTIEEENSAAEVIVTAMMSERDEIYIVCQKCKGFGRGYFIVYDSRGGEYRRAFWMGIYGPDEALVDVSKYCRKVARKMGYREPDEEVREAI